MSVSANALAQQIPQPRIQPAAEALVRIGEFVQSRMRRGAEEWNQRRELSWESVNGRHRAR